MRVAKSATPAASVRQTLYHTAPEEKARLLLTLPKDQDESVLVFTRTKHRADRLGRTLEQVGRRVAILCIGIGGCPNAARHWRNSAAGAIGFLWQLTAWPVTSMWRKSVMSNYDLPRTPEDSVHRIRRTGRMKALWRATSFATIEDARHIRTLNAFGDTRFLARRGAFFTPSLSRRHAFPTGTHRWPVHFVLGVIGRIKRIDDRAEHRPVCASWPASWFFKARNASSSGRCRVRRGMTGSTGHS